jgi:hypothetical protein
MKKKFYECDICDQKFGRKWNTQRHSQTIHSVASSIISNNNQHAISSMSQNKYSNYKKRLDMLNDVGKDLWNKDGDFSDIFKLDDKDFKIIKIIDQLIKPFNELEGLLINHDPKKKALILSKSFDLSLKSHNPVSTMNEMAELFRSIKGIKKIAKYHLLTNKNSVDPITDVKNKIKNSNIFERNNN